MIEAPATSIPEACDPASRRVHIITYGCQMNAFDSRRIAQVLRGRGYVETPDPAMADLVLINTCSVRDRPEKKVLGTLSRLLPLKEAHPGVAFGVCGCVAQQHGRDLLKRVPYLDLVFGTDNVADLPALLDRVAAGERVAFTEVMPRTDYAFVDVDPAIERGPCAFLTIMKGCDRFCAYCIVPSVRGREVSKTPERVVAEVRALVDAGVREVTLLGQNVNSYGKGLDEPADFVSLLERVAAVPGLARLRFVTSHPADADDRMLDAFGRLPVLAEALHLPLQSGSDRILAAMRRGYTLDAYLAKVARVRAACPDIALSTDMIVGFPGETDADFQASMDALEAARFDAMFSFKYSPRPGTTAARLADDVPEPVKVARLAALQALQDRIGAERMTRFQDRVEEVLVEGPSRDQASVERSGRIAAGMVEYFGRTRTGMVVNFAVPRGTPDPTGRLLHVRVDEVLVHSLRGVAVEGAAASGSPHGG
jgi:tRNA-2-methylthio-N6-dimethylallyladenosine synthase